jgi:hypothetical protein
MNYLLHLLFESLTLFVWFFLPENNSHERFPDGKYLKCQVLKAIPKQSLVDVSLRQSRKEGDLDYAL